MAIDFYTYDHHHHHEEEEEDEYIDMQVTSYSDFYCHHTNKPSSSSSSTLDPPHEYDPRGDFEFQMSSNSMEERDLTTTSSPADELFYNGKLLPLYPPPRLQMVENLLTSTLTSSFSSHPFQTKTTTLEDTYCTPLNTNTANTPIHWTTPFESCNVSPAASCQVSKELNIEEYLAEYACKDDHEERIDDNQLMNDNHEDDKVHSAAVAPAP